MWLEEVLRRLSLQIAMAACSSPSARCMFSTCTPKHSRPVHRPKHKWDHTPATAPMAHTRDIETRKVDAANMRRKRGTSGRKINRICNSWYPKGKGFSIESRRRSEICLHRRAMRRIECGHRLGASASTARDRCIDGASLPATHSCATPRGTYSTCLCTAMLAQRVCIHACMCACVRTCMRACMRVCVSMYICNTCIFGWD